MTLFVPTNKPVSIHVLISTALRTEDTLTFKEHPIYEIDKSHCHINFVFDMARQVSLKDVKAILCLNYLHLYQLLLF